MQQSTMMASANHPLSAANQLKATLTNNPQDSTEIPSLFQTFGQNDVSSGEDDDVEVLDVQQEEEYVAAGHYSHAAAGGGVAGHAAAAAGAGAASGHRGGAASNAASATRGGVAAMYPAGSSMSASRTAATASLNASRNRHPLNRSTHNPYVLLSSTDGTSWGGPEPAGAFPTAAAASTSTTARPGHRYSFSNSTSQNPLTFDYNASTNAGVDNVNSNSPSSNLMPGANQRRQPSQLLHSLQPPHGGQPQSHPASEPADGYWRDGNPMSMSSTDVRPVTTTTVGTLSAGNTGESQSINVNLRQRVRPSASSRTSSLSTSLVTLPVVQPVPSSAVAGNAAANGAPLPRPGSTGLTDESSPLSGASSNSTSADRRSGGVGLNTSLQQQHQQQQQQQQMQPQMSGAGNGPLSVMSSSTTNRSRMINVPSSAVVASEDAEERSNPSVSGGYHPDSPPQQQQQQQQAYEQYQPQAIPINQQQQGYYGYGGQSMSPPHSPYAHSPTTTTGYADPNYGGVPTHPGSYGPAKAVPYPPQAPMQQPQTPQQQQQHMSMLHNPAVAANYMNPYGQMMSNPNYCMGGPAVPGMMPGYGYAAGMPGAMHPYGQAAPQPGYGEGRNRRGGRGHQNPNQQQPQQANGSAMCGDATASTPSAHSNTSSGKSKNTKGKAQQGKQAGGKRSSVSSLQLDGKAAAAVSGENTGNNTATSSPTAGSSSKKGAKKQDDARFHANRSAPIQLFVVVKRKMEGQRYACPLSAQEVPVGSKMLVEGDRGADLGEVLAHVSMEQMARDCALVERRRKAALAKLQEQRAAGATAASAEEAAAAAAVKENGDEDASEVPQLSGEAARDYVLAARDWPWLIGPATPEDVEKLAPQREAEQQAFATAKPIVQQFIENRYQQRVARNEQALRAAASGEAANDAAPPSQQQQQEKKEDVQEAAAGEKAGQDASDDDGERRASLTPLTAEELQTLELSRQVTLVDCEYQFTREKITLFVSRPSRSIFVDFRRMQRKLYRTFRCRIWIAYMDEIADDEDAPESFVFVPPPSSSAAAASGATAAATPAAEEEKQTSA